MVATNEKSFSLTEDLAIKPELTPAPIDLLTVSLPTQPSILVQDDDRQTIPQQKVISEKTVDQDRSVLQLPSDFLKTPTTTYQPKYCALTLPDRLVESLQGQAQQDGIDERSFLLAAFNALLYRYTQQEIIDLELRLPADETNGTDTIEIRTQIHSELSVHALIRHISTTLNDVQRSFNARSLQSQPDTLSKPCTSLPIAVTFVEEFFRIEGREQLLPESQPQTSVASDYPDLHLIILQQESSVSGLLQYNASLFQAETIQRLAGHLQLLLHGIVDDRDCTIAQLPLLTQAERQQLAGWQSAAVSYPQTPIHQYIEAHAVQQPEAIALRFKDQQLTYAELNQRANQLAHYLTQIGVGAEVRVAVCVEPSLEVAVSLLGVFKAGGVYVPLDATYPTERLTVILEETQPKVLLTQAHLLPQLPTLAEHSLCLDQDWASLHSFPTHNLVSEINLNQTSHLIYTSGTTGQPKGVATSYGNLVQYILAAQERFGFNQHDVMPAIARFTFSITMFELLSPLVAGGTLVLLEREHILDFKRLTQTLAQLTVIHTSPSLLQKLLAYIQDNHLNLKPFQRLRHVSTGGDMVPAALLDTMKRVFQQAEIYVIYGCSEVSCMGCTYPVTRDQEITKSRVGKPFSNVVVRLYDTHQNLVPIGIPGEIYIGGAGVTKGYLQREALTQEKFVTVDGQRCYRTGDLGRLDADGNLEMLGRTDFQVKLRGIRIELGEIEATLRQIPGVREGIVTVRELWNGEKGLVAYVVLDHDQPLVEEIRRFLQTKLPDYMIPAAFVVLEAMPVNINQKVDRRALPAPSQTRLQQTGETVAPTSKLEQQLIEIWEQALNVHPISIKDNFFDLGGHSLLAIAILTQIEQTIGKHLSITTLYQAPTIETLAIAIGKEAAPVAACQSLMVIQPGASKPPLFCIHVLGRGLKFYRPLATYLQPEQPLYGLSVQIVNAEQAPLNRVEALAAYYIKEMQILQPEGPYFLAGVSFGGIVAFEIAQQLRSQGQAVGLLALLDTDGPEAITTALMNEKFSNHWNQLLQLGPSYAFEKVIDKVNGVLNTWKDKVADSLKKLACKYYVRHRLSLPDRLHDFMFADEHHQASVLYTPQTYAGRIVLFRATDRALGVSETLDPQLGWGKIATGGVDAFGVPGNHLSMLSEPHVQVLANHLRTYLD